MVEGGVLDILKYVLRRRKVGWRVVRLLFFLAFGWGTHRAVEKGRVGNMNNYCVRMTVLAVILVYRNQSSNCQGPYHGFASGGGKLAMQVATTQATRIRTDVG